MKLYPGGNYGYLNFWNGGHGGQHLLCTLENEPIGGNMYALNRYTENLFEMVDKDGRTVAKGSFKKVKLLCEAQGFTDLDLAKAVMEENNHNCADFGVFKRFIFSYNNDSLFRLAQ